MTTEPTGDTFADWLQAEYPEMFPTEADTDHSTDNDQEIDQ